MEGVDMEFQAGDVVRLRSGGPAMTVENVGEQYMSTEVSVWCVWFERVGNKQVVQRDTFPPVTLEKVQPGGIGAIGVTR